MISIELNRCSAPLTYTWEDENGTLNPQPNPLTNPTGLTPGTYTLVAEDATGCEFTTATTIKPYDVGVWNVYTNSADCNDENGEIGFYFNGDVAKDYEWIGSDSDVGVSNIINELPSGDYEIIVTDDDGCEQTFNETVQASSAPNCSCSADIDIEFTESASTDCVGGIIHSPCPGNQNKYKITFKNSGSSDLTERSWIYLTLDNGREYVSMDEDDNDFVRDSESTPTKVRFRTGTDIPQGVESFFYVTIDVPFSDTPADGWYTKIEFLNECVTSIPLLLSETVDHMTDACSCDPNDKLVTPLGCGSEGIINDQTLVYTIRFQNLGTGDAHDIRIDDLLDLGFDLSSLQIISSSHTVSNVYIDPESRLSSIYFDGIELPSFVFDAEGSKGYVTF